MENLMKVCNKCKTEKSILEYPKVSRNKDGLNPRCKVCINEYVARKYKENPERAKENNAKYKRDNPEKRKEGNKKWYASNIENVKRKKAKYYRNNCEKLKERTAKWIKSNPERSKETYAKYLHKMPDSYIKGQLRKENCSEELINNPEFIEVKRLIIKTKRLCKTSRN